MCGGGGGDPGAESRRQEEDRQARIRAATETINNVFNNKIEKSREIANPAFSNLPNGILSDRLKQQIPKTINEKYWVDGDPSKSREDYENQKSAVYDLNKTELDRQASEAERMNRFGLARAGLIGGSANIDSNADINRRTNEGLMKVGGIADQASADLKASDERTRSNLLSMAQSGIDTGTAAQQALKGLEVNTADAASKRSASTIGNLFNDMSQAYLYRQMLQGQNSGIQNQFGAQWFGVSPPNKTYLGS